MLLRELALLGSRVYKPLLLVLFEVLESNPPPCNGLGYSLFNGGSCVLEHVVGSHGRELLEILINPFGAFFLSIGLHSLFSVLCSGVFDAACKTMQSVDCIFNVHPQSFLLLDSSYRTVTIVIKRAVAFRRG
jgi:hypothetical protein